MAPACVAVTPRCALGISLAAKTHLVLCGILENPCARQSKCKSNEETGAEMKRLMGSGKERKGREGKEKGFGCHSG